MVSCVKTFLAPLLGVVAALTAIIASVFVGMSRPQTVFDYAFERFSLDALEPCPGFDAQKSLFLSNRGDLPAAQPADTDLLTEHWELFLESDRGEGPDGCTWKVETYPAGFIATGPHTVIVINPSNTVIGAPLPGGTTGDLVMDATRYSATSLGAFRGAATIPPRSLAVISLR
jgi:hypothetical protein